MAALEHLSAGFVAQRFAPRLPLWLLLVATEVIDFLWILFTLFGMDPGVNQFLSHGLFMSVVWSLAGGLIIFFIYKSLRSGLIFGLAVFSHWVMDFITHPMGFLSFLNLGSEPNLPLLFADSPKVGLGLYNSLPGFAIGFPLLLLPGVVLCVLYVREKLLAEKGEKSTQVS